MMIASSIITTLPKSIIPFTETQIQQFGLAAFVVGVILTLAVSAIEEFIKGRNEPRLFISGITTELKPIFLPSKGNLLEGAKAGNYEFAYAIIENNPKNETDGLSAQFANAKIIFETKNGKKKEVEYLRWCDAEYDLFPMFGGDIKALKKIHIDPGNPEFLSIGI